MQASRALPADPVQQFVNRLANAEPSETFTDPLGRIVQKMDHNTVRVDSAYDATMDVYTVALRARLQTTDPFSIKAREDGCDDGGQDA